LLWFVLVDKFFGYLLSLKTRNNDYISSYINWTIVKTTNEKNRFQVKQWNSVEIHRDRRFHFIKTFNQVCLFSFHLFYYFNILLFKLSDNLSTIPLNDANILLVEQPTYRFPNLKLATYVSQLQQIRAHILDYLLVMNNQVQNFKELISSRHFHSEDLALNRGIKIMENFFYCMEIIQEKKN
jgi:hypothetical protein